LEHLARHFKAGPTRVVKEDRYGFLYESDAFAGCTASEDVLAIADGELRTLSGVFKLVRESHEPLRSGAVYKTNAAGGKDVFVHVQEVLQVRVEFGEPTITVTDSAGNDITPPSPPPRTVVLARLAATDVAVAKALRLLAAPDSKSWVGLYRMHEVVEADVGGEKTLKKRG
jgi:ABC-type Fe3+-hydroxamate transport system substrate-binding protein